MPAALKTLKKSSAFRHVSRSGQKWITKAFIIQLCKQDRRPDNGPPENRLGLTVSRKVGKAVVRNRVKRRLREMARIVLPSCDMAGHDAGYDIVLIARAGAETYDFTALQKDLRWALKRLEVI